MGVRRTFQLVILLCLALTGQFGRVKAERWSRQVSNSEWIPLADPRINAQTQVSTNSPGSGILPTDSSQLPLTLPPALQHQYQQQLLQLQKTQENIQKLLLLQQQLRAQQQLLQSQAILPSGFAAPEDDKQGLQQQGLPDLAPEVLVPPIPSSEALPPVFSAQNFLSQKPSHAQQSVKQVSNNNQEFVSFPSQGQVGLHSEQEDEELLSYPVIEKAPQQEAKRVKGHDLAPQQPPLPQTTGDEEEEVQLVYVPAETLAQRGQPKRGRGRKQFPSRLQQQQQQQYRHQQQQTLHETQNINSDTITNEQDAYARQILQQLQKEHEEKAQLLKEERLKEIARLNEEQKALERKSRLQQEALQREQELQKQREAEKKRKEHERLEELAKQRELDKIREAREKQRLEELEKRRQAEIRAKEERRKEEERRREEEARQREADRLAALERQKELELQRSLEEQRILENQQRETNTKTTLHSENHGESLPLIREQQLHRQHLTETTRPKSKTRSRQRVRQHHYQEQQSHRETTTTPSPNQPPLSVYMGSGSLKKSSVKVSDVLKILKDAKTIAVLDTVSAGMPQVFVGPTNLEPPTGYSKFDLPYLSSLDHNRVERRVDKLPFFVAPLSFDPPSGYSKIPFPAPHIGSVVVNNIDNAESNRQTDEHDPNPTPLIEPNSYSVDNLDHKASISTTPTYDSQTTASYTQASPSSQRFESTYSSSAPTAHGGSRFRFRQYYNDNKPTAVVSTYYEDQRPTTRKHKYYEESARITTPSFQSPKVETSISQSDISYSSTPRYEGVLGPQVSSPRPHDLSAQLALLNHEYTQERESQRYNTDQYHQSPTTSGSSDTFAGEISLGKIDELRTPVGPTQYNLPAELPAISPQLPGLVNSLVEKEEAKLQSVTTPTTTTIITTTTTTTPRPTTTTYRSRGRQRTRVTPSRSRTSTTQATSSSSSTRPSTERTRRPFNRSRSRFTTTTEEYRESAYEPTKSKAPETALRNNKVEQRRANVRNQKYRGREKQSQQNENHNIQAQQATGYDNVSHGGSTGPGAPETFLSSNHPSAPEANVRQEQLIPPGTSVPNDFTQENYPQTTLATTENYPQLPVNHDSPLVSDDYTKNQNYPQNRPQEVQYQDVYNHPPSTGYEQPSLEKTPVNGFNYQAHQNDETLEQTILPRPKEYLQYQGKLDNSDFELATTEDPRLRGAEEQRYSSIYEVNMPQAQPEYAITGQGHYQGLDSEKVGSTVADPNEPPIFVPLPQNKQEDYELRVSSTEAPLTDTTMETTTVSTTPVIIRQRVRGRIGGRGHHDSAVQTRPRGSQDEYVRFSIVNQDSTRSGSRHRENSKSRTRTRPQSHVTHIQTDGNDYIKIQAHHHQKQVATTTPRPTTTTTTMVPEVADQDADYGFIRPPNFQPVHPVEDRFTPPVTYRPSALGVQSQGSLAHDGVESNQPQLLKNRPKYQQTPNRRPANKATTLPPTTQPTVEAITTTERVPIATTLPDDSGLYTTRPKSRTDDSKHTRIRGRIRRPGKKRVTTTTTTTENVLETHNELPLDENYPRIPPSLPPSDQQTLYEENYEASPQFAPIRNGANQYYEPSSENYPTQDFILNFGNLPEQVGGREEYDQTQLASNPPRKYSHAERTRPTSPENSQSTPTDIYGAESQWSTKLTSTSFQPSFVGNRVANERAKSHQWNEDTANEHEIITAGPDVSSVTFVVSSDLNNNDDSSMQDEESMLGTTTFGQRMNGQDHTEVYNSTSFTNAPTTLNNKDKSADDTETTYNMDSWLTQKTDSSTEALTTIDLERTTKRNPDSPVTRKVQGTRRRKVRVRVRPSTDDFVTAESQHFNSAVNSLIHEHYKFNPIRESKLTTPEPVTTTSTQRSVLQDFLEEILKDDETSVPVRATSTSTELPEDIWSMSTPVTTQNIVPDKIEESTLNEDHFTTISSADIERDNEKSYLATTTARVSHGDEDTSLQYGQKFSGTVKNMENPPSKKKINDEKKETKVEERKKHTEDEQEETTQASLSTSSRLFTQKYSIPENARTTEKLDMSTKQVKFPKGDEEVKTFSKMMDDMDNHSKLTKENKVSKDNDDNNDYPKNHRSHWSEVRYPSELEASEISAWNHETVAKSNTNSGEAIPGTVTKTEGNNSVRTISDYVKAIFDTMKSAEEESQGTVDKLPETTTVTNDNEDSKMNTVEDAIVTRIETSSTVETRKPSTIGPTTKLQPENITSLKQTTTESVTSLPEVSTTTNTPNSTTSITKNTEVPVNTTQSALGKVLRTSTTTKVSHMTEICYRGRCVMTRPKQDDRSR